MFSRSQDGFRTIHISVPFLCLEGLLLAAGIYYLSQRKLGADPRFSILLSLFAAGSWVLLSLFSFLYVAPAVLMGTKVLGGLHWLGYTILIFLLLFLSGRYLVLLPWPVAGALAALVSSMWFLGMCFERAF